MNKGLLKVEAILEVKIEKAERRAQKASDRAFVLSQKIAFIDISLRRDQRDCQNQMKKQNSHCLNRKPRWLT